MSYAPFRSSRQHLSNDDCLEDEMKNYQNCSALYCVRYLRPLLRKHLWAGLRVDCWFRFGFSLDLGLLFVFFSFCSCVLCAFCSANFRFFSTKPRECLGRTSPNLPILCREGRQTSTQSINRYATHMHMVCVMVRCLGVPSVYHKPVLYRNGSMDRPGFRHRG